MNNREPQTPRYRVQWLEGTYFTRGGVSLNNQGQVVGSTEDRVFVWQNGRKQFPPPLVSLPAVYIIPFCINDRGAIGGSLKVARSGAISYDEFEGFFWDGRLLKRTGNNSGDKEYTIVTAINNKGQITGSTVQLLLSTSPDTLGGTTSDASTRGVGQAINDTGLIVGYKDEVRSDGTIYTTAIQWQGERMVLLPSLDGKAGMAQGVNNRGWIVGWSENRAGVSQATLWQDGNARNLGGLPGGHHSEATAINPLGQVIGATFYKDGRNSHDNPGPQEYLREPHQARAFLWQRGQMYDLNQITPLGAGQTLAEARAINNRGHIAGFGTAGGKWRVFLLTPTNKS